MSLIELMITLTLTALAMAAIYGAFFRTQRAAQTVVAEVDSRQGLRAAMQIIERDMRMAGSGWGRIEVYGAYGGAPLTLRGIKTGYGGVSASDSVSILGAWDAGTTLREAMAVSTGTIKCVSVAGFTEGDLVVVTNGAVAHLFQVTTVLSATNNLLHDATSTFNASGGHLNWPPNSGYAIGARVFKVRWVVYRIDSTSYDKPALVRWEVGKAPQLVADDVESFRTVYRLADGSSTRNPSNFMMIDKITPVLYAPPTSASSPQDSARSTVRPRAF